MIRTLAVIALGLSTASSALGQDMNFERPYWLDRAVIEALGRAELEVPADRASFSVTFTEVDGNARDAMFAASDRARLAAAAIRSRGGQGVSIQSSAEIETIHQEYRNRDGERVSSERADQVENYAVNVTLNVAINDISRAVATRAAAVAVGPESISDLSFSLDENAPARMRAYRAAVQDAAARARVAAEASGAPLGRLLVLQEGQGPCLGRWYSAAAGDGARSRDNVQTSPSAMLSVGEEAIVVTGSRVRELRLTAEDIERMRLPSDIPPLGLSAQVCAIYAVG
ncbi:MAG: SIMPL domain-containing protein [Hyphomonadaceae bacterium]|nr:SIMPL domain-containing protein [Hyphomonadaceae bacterium]